MGSAHNPGLLGALSRKDVRDPQTPGSFGVVERELDKQTHILAGVIPIKSAGMARYMRDYVSGVTVPDEVVTRMEQAKDAKVEGAKIAVEIIEQVKEIPGIHGVHIMAVGWEDIVPEIVKQAGLLPRPVL